MPKRHERKDVSEAGLVQVEVELFPPTFLEKLRGYQQEFSKIVAQRREREGILSEADVAQIQTALLVKHGLVGGLKSDGRNSRV